MANYQPTWRSNYFRVRDRAAFDAWISAYDSDIIVETRSRDGHEEIALLQHPDSENGIPVFLPNPDGDVMEDVMEVNFPAELAEHLAADSVAILQEVGHERVRYVYGYAVAIRADGRTLDLSLGDLAKRVQRYWHLTPTEAML